MKVYRFLISSTLLFLCYGAVQPLTLAPKCALVSTVERLNESKAVFTGRVDEIQESNGIQVVRFHVTKSWKYVRAKEVTLLNYVHHEGPYFEKGHSYLVFAYARRAKLATGGCSGSLDVRFAGYQIVELDKWQAANDQKKRYKP